MSLPHYIVEKVQDLWTIWDTVKHEFAGLHFKTKESAAKKCEEMNKGKETTNV